MDAPASFKDPLSKDVKFLKGVGPRGGLAFEKLGIRTVGDLLFLFPRRHQDRRNLPPISRAEPGEYVTVRGRLTNVSQRPTKGGMVIVKALLDDGSVMVAGTTIDGRAWLKFTLLNPQTSLAHLREIIETIATTGEALLAEDELDELRVAAGSRGSGADALAPRPTMAGVTR